jgi:hypothetical protein
LKKDSGLRLCVDYYMLNKVTVKNRLVLSLISKILDHLIGKNFLSKLDLENAYYCILVAEKNRWKTAFYTWYSHFKYMIMLFKLTNAPATFQTYINYVLSRLVDIICIVYLDDILIFLDTHKDYVKHVCIILDRLCRYSLYVNLKKYSLFQNEVDFLKFIMGKNNMKMDCSCVNAIT